MLNLIPNQYKEMPLNFYNDTTINTGEYKYTIGVVEVLDILSKEFRLDKRALINLKDKLISTAEINNEEASSIDAIQVFTKENLEIFLGDIIMALKEKEKTTETVIPITKKLEEFLEYIMDIFNSFIGKKKPKKLDTDNLIMPEETVEDVLDEIPDEEPMPQKEEIPEPEPVITTPEPIIEQQPAIPVPTVTDIPVVVQDNDIQNLMYFINNSPTIINTMDMASLKLIEKSLIDLSQKINWSLNSIANHQFFNLLSKLQKLDINTIYEYDNNGSIEKIKLYKIINNGDNIKLIFLNLNDEPVSVDLEKIKI